MSPKHPARSGEDPASPSGDPHLTQQRLAAIVESSDDAIMGKDLDGIVTSWNRAAERMFGFTAAEAIGRSIMAIVPPERRDEEHEVLSRIRLGGRVDHFETTRRCKDGTRLDVSISVSPIRNAEGAVAGASTIARDITERRRLDRARDELLDRERQARADAVVARDRLAFLAEISALLTSSLDYEETLDRAVHVALPRLGDYCTVLVAEEGGGLRLAACGHVDPDQEAIVRSMAHQFVEQPAGIPTFSADVLRTRRSRIVRNVMSSEEVAIVERTRPELMKIHSAFRPCSYVGVPLFGHGRTTGVLAFGTTMDQSRHQYSDADLPLIEDFARRVSLAVENARLFREAGELNRLKDEFLATLSHELRTPLNAILGWSRMLAGGRLDDDSLDRAIISIERNAAAQSKIVDDILDVARGLAGSLRLELEPLDLVDLARRGVDAATPAAAAKHLIIAVDAPDRLGIVADGGRLQQVIGNLLSNAVKFTPERGQIRVEIATVDGSAELRVVDSGIGIAEHFVPHVFDKFRQADGSFTRQYGGLGLGLAIARNLVELHGGTIQARSAGKNQGSTFIVRLPLGGPSDQRA